MLMALWALCVALSQLVGGSASMSRWEDGSATVSVFWYTQVEDQSCDITFQRDAESLVWTVDGGCGYEE